MDLPSKHRHFVLSLFFFLFLLSLSTCIPPFLALALTLSRNALENVYTLLQPPRLPGSSSCPGEVVDGTVEEKRMEEPRAGVMEIRSVQGMPLTTFRGNKHPFYTGRMVQSESRACLGLLWQHWFKLTCFWSQGQGFQSNKVKASPVNLLKSWRTSLPGMFWIFMYVMGGVCLLYLFHETTLMIVYV